MVKSNAAHWTVRFYIVLLLLLSNVVLFAQSQLDTKLFLSADRNLFIVGEEINLKLYSTEFEKNSFNKTYVYCDLVGQDGLAYQGIKVELQYPNCSFRLSIPENLLSGNYILRAYTHEMRNNPDTYALLWIRILNPDNPSVLKATSTDAIDLVEDSLCFIENIKIEGLNEKCKARSKISLSVDVLDSNLELNSLSISVIPTTSFSKSKLKYNYKKVVETKVETKYRVEKNGISFKGRLISKSKSTNLGQRRIYFSIRGTEDIFSCISDSDGYFRTYLHDLYGRHDIYITTERTDNDISIQIMRAFDTQTIYHFDKAFSLTKPELSLALQMAKNIAVEQAFKKSLNKTSKDTNIRSFYNKPDEMIVINDYVDLAHLSDYFTELPGNVHLHMKHGKYEMRIINPAEIQLFMAPLIMVDYVVVNDLQSVLKMDPKGINRIEIVRDYYQKGDASFGGIVNFITNKNDFGGYEFPNSSISISYDFLTPMENVSAENLNDSVPDARNTQFWSATPQFINGKYQFEFRTSDTPGNYSILIQGIDKNGRSCYFLKSFIVE